MVNMSDIDIWLWRLNEEEGEMSCIKKKKKRLVELAEKWN